MANRLSYRVSSRFKHIRQLVALVAGQVGQSQDVPAAGQQQHFKRPGRPVRDDGHPVLVGDDDSLLQFLLPAGVVDQQRRAVLAEVVRLTPVLLGGLFRQRVAGPDLAVGMRVGASHDLAFVLEHLHPAIRAAEFLDLLGPDIDDIPDLGQRHFRQGPVMPRRKTDDATGASHGLPSQQRIVRVPGRPGHRAATQDNRS